LHKVEKDEATTSSWKHEIFSGMNDPF
jgi:hypothetical protein